MVGRTFTFIRPDKSMPFCGTRPVARVATLGSRERADGQHAVAVGAVALRRASWGRSAASRPSEIWLTRCDHRAICASPLGFLPPCGAVAQLGERLNGIQEVEGSTPFGSTLPFP